MLQSGCGGRAGLQAGLEEAAQQVLALDEVAAGLGVGLGAASKPVLRGPGGGGQRVVVEDLHLAVVLDPLALVLHLLQAQGGGGALEVVAERRELSQVVLGLGGLLAEQLLNLLERVVCLLDKRLHERQGEALLVLVHQEELLEYGPVDEVGRL